MTMVSGGLQLPKLSGCKPGLDKNSVAVLSKKKKEILVLN